MFKPHNQGGSRGAARTKHPLQDCRASGLKHVPVSIRFFSSGHHHGPRETSSFLRQENSSEMLDNTHYHGSALLSVYVKGMQGYETFLSVSVHPSSSAPHTHV